MTAGGATTHYALDVAGGLPEVIAASGGATTHYLQVQGQVLAQYDSGTWGYVAPDALGSVRQVVDLAGSVTLAQSYDPFGNALEVAGSAESVFGYTGEQMDASTGLVYLRARYYGSGTGRFLSKDPWKGDDLRPQSLNGWSYVEGNPINRIDPRGRCYGPATFLRSIPGERELCENLDLAIIISTHPGATEQQKEQARAYITLWWVGHSTLVAGSAYLAFYGYTQLAQFIALSKEVAEQGCPPPPESPPLYQPLPPDKLPPDWEPKLPPQEGPYDSPIPFEDWWWRDTKERSPFYGSENQFGERAKKCLEIYLQLTESRWNKWGAEEQLKDMERRMVPEEVKQMQRQLIRLIEAEIARLEEEYRLFGCGSIDWTNVPGDVPNDDIPWLPEDVPVDIPSDDTPSIPEDFF
jgi:RHS repeat-associated protein